MKVFNIILSILLILTIVTAVTVGFIVLHKSTLQKNKVNIELSYSGIEDDDSSENDKSECQHEFSTEQISDLFVVEIINGWDPVGFDDIKTTASVLLSFDTSLGQYRFYCLWRQKTTSSSSPGANLGAVFSKCYMLNESGKVLTFIDVEKIDYFSSDYVDCEFKLNNDIRILGFTGLLHVLSEEPAIIKYSMKSDICSKCGQKRS